MKKFLLSLVALSILNQCIDIDYCTTTTASGDDIDCIYELVIEKFIGDPNYTGEEDNDDDDAGPRNLQGQKDASSCLYCQEFKVTPEMVTENTSSTTCLFIASIISKGHCFIAFPPPDHTFSC